MSKYRFKTKDEFIRDGLWDDEYNIPVGWSVDGLMNHFLGEDVPKEMNEKCDGGSDLVIDGWFFTSNDYILKEEKGNWAVWYPKKEINSNGFEYFGDKVMEVSQDGKRWITRAVFGKKNGRYIAWAGGGCHNLEGARNTNGAISWKYARRIKTKLTLQEIADKFGLDVNEIEII